MRTSPQHSLVLVTAGQVLLRPGALYGFQTHFHPLWASALSNHSVPMAGKSWGRCLYIGLGLGVQASMTVLEGLFMMMACKILHLTSLSRTVTQ